MWQKIDVSVIDENRFYLTCINDNAGIRNKQHLKYSNGLWFTMDGSYIYYNPTHYFKG